VLAIAHLGKGGGVALQALQLFQDLRRTIDVELVCLDAPGPHRHLTQEPGVVVAGPLVFPKGIRTLSQALRSTRRRGDVFHALDPYYAFPATYLARVFPRIVSLNGSRTRNRDAVRPHGRGPDAGGDGPVPIPERGRDELEGLGRSVPGLPSAGDLEWTRPSKVRTTSDERGGATTPRSPDGSDAPHLRRESDSRKTSRMDPRGPAAAPPRGGRHRRRIQGGALRRPVLSRTPRDLRGRRLPRPLHRRGALGPRAIVSGRVGRLRLPIPLGRLSQRGHRGDGRRPSVGRLRH